jgi:flagellar hook-associated protein 3 FlgL
MRISSRMFQQSAMQSLRASLAALAQAQRQSASGRRVQTVSDDPIDASQIMRIDSQLRDIAQYQRNAASAQTRLSTEDAVLTAARNLLARARGIALSGAVNSPSDPLRQAAVAEVQQVKEQLIALGNTKLGNEYIFGGGETMTAPFLPDGTYIGNTNVRQAQIDGGVMIDTNHTGDQMFSAALQSLDALTNELQTGTPESIQNTLPTVASAEQQTLIAQTEVGSRLQEIDLTGKQLATRTTDFQNREGAIRDLDPAVAAIQVVSAQNALERSYAVVGRILSTNLFDYLR